MSTKEALSGFATYVTAAECMDIHGGTEYTALAIKEAFSEGRPVMLNMADVKSITTAGTQLLLSLHQHYAEEIFFDEVPESVMETLRFVGADQKIINWLQEQA